MAVKLSTRLAMTTIRALGLSCSYSSDLREYRVDYHRTDSRYVSGELGSAYFTNDAADAIATARAMAAQLRGRDR